MLSAEMATLSRLRESTKSARRALSTAEELAMDTMTTGASWPWNLSTVPTATSSWPDSARPVRIWLSWAL